MKRNIQRQGRRKFLGTMIAGWIAMIFLPVLYVIAEYLLPPKLQEALMRTILAGKVGDIPPNTAKIVKYNKKPVIVVHTPTDGIRAFSAVCTHLGCVVDYDKTKSEFHCYCHDSVYDLNGKNVSGPSRTPLAQFPVNISNDEIIIQAPSDPSVFGPPPKKQS